MNFQQGEAVNMRLNTSNLTLVEISEILAQKNMTFGELYAIPEQDGWMYSDGLSYVCSSFVTAIYKAGGLFGSNEINAVEFTPKDLVNIDFWDLTSPLPQICKDADPDLPYCQRIQQYQQFFNNLCKVMGDYYIKFSNMNKISPYAHMNEKCPSQPPEYIRPDNC